ncbi:hypothetical protein KQY30_01670 [Streptomyces sp. GMY02]|uniref:WD40 repeat domain-containing protein n=1 Tax=Streptomyces sp. GMY02 TaxID=1333528 RepID=UPI001C2C0942|nr:hypothetical protein [Streptomyces sp. GMY02]QXE33197.1 hypothetical protein KQY30_01670 [Streptomyces sp. GMY02]
MEHHHRPSDSQHQQPRVSSLAFSPDGRTLATSGDNTSPVRLWDTATGFPQATYDGHTSGVLALTFSPDGHTLATGGRDGTIRLWKTGQTSPAHTIQKICQAVRRDLTPEEQAAHLPGRSPRPICSADTDAG